MGDGDAALGVSASLSVCRVGNWRGSADDSTFPPEVSKQLRLLAETLNDLFAKNGKPEIAPLERD